MTNFMKNRPKNVKITPKTSIFLKNTPSFYAKQKCLLGKNFVLLSFGNFAQFPENFDSQFRKVFVKKA